MTATDVRHSAKGSLWARAVSGRLGRRRLSRAVIWVVLVIVAVAMLFPLLWMVSSSFKLEQRVFMFPPRLIPNPIRLANYVEALTYKPFPIYLRNTVFLVLMNELAILLAASFCAYGFARIRFPGRDLWFSLVLFTMMVPYVVMMVPLFVIFSRLGWVDTFLPLIVPYFFGGGGFNIFLLRQFFRTIPEELADAARIDGCSEFGIYWRIMLPLAKPAGPHLARKLHPRRRPGEFPRLVWLRAGIDRSRRTDALGPADGLCDNDDFASRRRLLPRPAIFCAGSRADWA
jgi:ABC-type glycerol-3-phosphate transport system permease component